MWDCSAHRSLFINQRKSFILQMTSDHLILASNSARCCCHLHCCCSNWQLLSLWVESKSSLEVVKLDNMITTLIHETETSRSCCVRKSLQFTRKYCKITSNWDISGKMMAVTKNCICASGENFIGIVDKEKRCPSFRVFVLLALEEIMSLTTTHEMRGKLVCLNTTCQEILKIPKIHDLSDLIPFFVDEDDKLLQFSESVVDIFSKIDDRQPIHNFFEKFLQTINFDAQVLLDWMTSDEDTCLPLLRLLLNYLKLDKTGRCPETQDALSCLHGKLQRLQDKSLLPFDSTPLIRLLEDNTSDRKEQSTRETSEDM